MLIIHIKNESMSESPVETLRKALGLHFISKRGLTCFDNSKATWSSLLEMLMMPDNFLI